MVIKVLTVEISLLINYATFSISERKRRGAVKLVSMSSWRDGEHYCVPQCCIQSAQVAFCNNYVHILELITHA